ncbi:MAG: nucleoside recognition domain-containing protein [Rhodothermales bacterium]
MLNYIWAGLIIFSLVFAVAHDVRDIVTDRYRNEQALPVRLQLPEGYQPDARRVNVEVMIDPATYGRFYGTDVQPDSAYPGYLVRTQEGVQLRFASDVTLPEPLATIRGYSATRDDELQGVLGAEDLAPDSLYVTSTVEFAPVRFVKLNAITEAAFDFAETAATLALGLIGILALFLGLLKIAEASGIVAAVVRFTQPIFRPLFPEIPEGHPALGVIVLNLTANMLGLGNAATPLGIKAMEELQKLNTSSDTATNSMVMLLALNTASVQLVPPTLLVAVMGLQVNELILPIIIVTVCSAIVAIVSAKLLQRLPSFRDSDPALRSEDTSTESDNQ